MKLLKYLLALALFLLLTSISVMGQGRDTSKLHLELLVQLQNEQIELYESALQNSKDATTSLLILVSQLEDSIKILKQNNTLDLILAYADECYADSSLECYHIFIYETNEAHAPCNSTLIDPYMNPAYRGKKEIWTHKQPTFEGFIEYLRKRTR